MRTVSVFEGKNKFSELVASASTGEPQVITKNGTETAVLISFEEYKRLTAKEKPLVELMLDNPCHKYGIEIDLTRDRDAGRQIPDFSENEDTEK